MPSPLRHLAARAASDRDRVPQPLHRNAAIIAALWLGTTALPVAHAQTSSFGLAFQGKEAEAIVRPAGAAPSSAQVNMGDPPANLSVGTVPNPADYGAWRLAPSDFVVSRGDARNFSVAFGEVGTPALNSGVSVGSSFQSVIRYQPTVNAFGVTLKVDPLQMFFGFTGSLEGATPQLVNLGLAATSRFRVDWLDGLTPRTIGPSFQSQAVITDSGPLAAYVESAIVSGATSTPVNLNAVTFADQSSGFASITAPAFELSLQYDNLPETSPGSFAELFLVYEMSVSGAFDVVGLAPDRDPFMFARWGDPIALGSGGAQPYIAITPVPEPATVALMLAGLGVVGAAAKRRRAISASGAARPADA